MSLRRWLASSSSRDATPSLLPQGAPGTSTDAAKKQVLEVSLNFKYVHECDVFMDVKTLTFLDVKMYPGYKT